jgi:hypothetical protein
MKKFRLEDIDKRQVFNKPPDDYFEKLPGIIQAKTANKSKSNPRTYLLMALKLAPVAGLLVFLALYSGVFSSQESGSGFDDMLSEVSNEDIIWYLEELDLTSDEIFEEVDLKALSHEIDDMRNPLLESMDIEDEAFIELYDDYNMQEGLL